MFVKGTPVLTLKQSLLFPAGASILGIALGFLNVIAAHGSASVKFEQDLLYSSKFNRFARLAHNLVCHFSVVRCTADHLCLGFFQRLLLINGQYSSGTATAVFHESSIISSV